MIKGAQNTLLAAEKRKLIADGELYRVGLVCAKALVAQELRPEALWQGVLSHALGFAAKHVEHILAPSGLRLQSVMPYLLTGMSLIARKKMVKPALGVIVALAVTWLIRKKRR